MKVLLLALLLTASPVAAAPCTYSDWTWHTRQKKAVDVKQVIKDRSELTKDEMQNGCSICSQDQIEINFPGLQPFRICRRYSDRIRQALATTLNQGWPVRSLVGYRVGKTKGGIDTEGRRTQYSLHSFGLALDVNEDHNGLYDQCMTFSPKCILLRGGRWDPAAAFSIRKDSPLYQALTAMGWKWGGEIAGKQKDFMHFSPTGY